MSVKVMMNIYLACDALPRTDPSPTSCKYTRGLLKFASCMGCFFENKKTLESDCHAHITYINILTERIIVELTP